jgi:general secretion pathway protein H
MKWAATKQSGFTLVEMLVVLSLLALTAAVSLPYARTSIEARRFDVTVQSITLFLRNAQVAALASSHDVEVRYSTDKHQFTSTAKQPPLIVPKDVGMTVHTIEGLVQNGGAGFVFFAGGGNSGGKIVLKLGNEIQAVKLNWLTGAITTASPDSSP